MILVSRHAAAGTFWTHAAFWRQVTLNAVSPIVAVVFGGIIVNFVVRLAQRRRERQELRSSLSLDMIQAAYGFYRPLIEVIRKESYSAPQDRTDRHLFIFRSKARRQSVDFGDLAQQYEEFRMTARVIEEQLRISFRKADARWLWHGVVDMLSARYYRLAHTPQRFNDMIKTHGEHRIDPEIPEDTRQLFMTLDDYRNEKTVDAELLLRYETLLNEAIRVVLKQRIHPPSGAAFVRPGRGSLGSTQVSSTLN
jgi:hypothetical protein